MSRHIIQSEKYLIAYGYDNVPGMGYFFQVYDKSRVDEDDEGLIVNEGYTEGLSYLDMTGHMVNIHAYDCKVNPKFTEHLVLVSANKPI